MARTKGRFDALDVAAEVRHLQATALGRRIVNIYNATTNGETYIFKLDKGSASDAGSSNLLLLLESGVRFHTQNQDQQAANPAMPSPFCAKLRKHLRGLRLESITQLGRLDRVVHFVFGSGDRQRHSLLLELYAKGNLVLTDSSYTILALLRSHEYKQQQQQQQQQQQAGEATSGGGGGDGGGGNTPNEKQSVQVRVGHAYPVTYATTMTATSTASASEESCTTTTTTAAAAAATNGASTTTATTTTSTTLLNTSNPMEWYLDHQGGGSGAANDTTTSLDNNTTSKTTKKKKGDKNSSQSAWKQLLLNTQDSGVSHYGPNLIEHCLLTAGLWGNNARLPSQLDADEWKRLQDVLQDEGGRVLKAICQQGGKGYILYQEKKPADANIVDQEKDADDQQPDTPGASPFDDKVLLEFQPHVLLKQHEGVPRLEYDIFDGAVDVFFSHLESQKRTMRAEQQEHQAQQRLEKIKLDQEQRVQTLLGQQESLQEEARLVEMHADTVEKALQVVNSALDNGMDWDQLEDLVELEKTQNHNPVAMIIHKLDLEHDQMVLELLREEVMFEESDTDIVEKNGDRYLYVTVSLNETAHGNSKALFAKYRASKEKSQKTIEASARAMEAAEETARRQMLEAQSKKSHVSSMQTKRKPLWFEKFNWFITTDNYLVLGGRDAQQNELLVKRYLRAGDAYLHADVHGAASCVLRAKRRRDAKSGKTATLPLSSQAIREAGNFTICRSSAWTSRMVTSAWWVESHQVSKTAPTGEYLTVGSFMVRGKKNFLPPTQLEMGLAVLFRLGDDDSVLRHKNERRDFALMQLEEVEDDFADGKIATLTKGDRRIASKNDVPEHVLDDRPKAVEESSTTGSSLVTSDMQRKAVVALEKTCDSPAPALTKRGENDTEDPLVDERSVYEDGQERLDEQSSAMKKKKGLSVKERKLIKKYGSLEGARNAEEERIREEEKRQIASGTSAVVSNSEAQSVSTQVTNKRGKKAKMKRMAKKYVGQDEEDRELALLALHAGEKEKKTDKKKPPQISEKEKEAAAETIAILKKDSAAIAQQLPPEVHSILAECVTVQDGDDSIVRWDKFDGDALEQLLAFENEAQMIAAANRLSALKDSSRIDNFSASLAGIIRTVKKYGHENLNKQSIDGAGTDGKRKNKAEKQAEQQSWKKTLAEEGLAEADEDETEDTIDDTTELNRLTGKPQGEDLILFAVPVCAPYQTLSQYSFRVKLTPGNMKRGKASKQCVDILLKEGGKAAGTDPCRDLIKKVADNDWVQAICGDVKISAAGASKAIQKAKTNMAKSKKNK